MGKNAAVEEASDTTGGNLPPPLGSCMMLGELCTSGSHGLLSVVLQACRIIVLTWLLHTCVATRSIFSSPPLPWPELGKTWTNQEVHAMQERSGLWSQRPWASYLLLKLQFSHT